jgi:hypothetical protein
MTLTRALAHQSRPIAVTLVSVALLAMAGALPGVRDGAAGAGAQLTGSEALMVQPPGPTRERISTFNVLGASHTAPGGDRKGWESGEVRMGYAVRLIRRHHLGIIGFQELQKPQFRVFRRKAGDEFRVYPGGSFGTAAMQNSIAWRSDDWTLVSTQMIPVPYFDGNIIRKPLVLLQNNVTGQRVYVFNTHNPADTRGPAQKWRDKAVTLETDLVNDLRAESPAVPVLFTGDMNDREKFFCPIVGKTDLEAANGGEVTADGTCRPPVPTRIDWILGTPNVAFTGYVALDQGLINKTSDHPLFWADASIAPLVVRQAAVKRVLVLDVEGLPSAALEGGTLPSLTRLLADGSSTLNARTARERTTSLPNLTGILTGRPVYRTNGGHGVTANRDSGQTVHDDAGRYVSSVFDVAHNAGLRTAFVATRPRTAFLTRSWNALNGRRDPAGDDDGTNKIDRVVMTEDDAATTASLVSMLVNRGTPALTVAQLSAPAMTGHRRGFASRAYDAALATLDHQVGRLLDTITSHRRLATGTVVVLTADSGGTGRSSRDKTRPHNYRIPLAVWGATVPVGGDLYAMNPAWTDPGVERGGYGLAQPLRNANVASVVTALLRLPGIPGSTLDQAQQLNVLVASDTGPPAALQRGVGEPSDR